jgi:hypothetical protein
MREFTQPVVEALRGSKGSLRASRNWQMAIRRRRPRRQTEFLRQFGLVALAAAWARMAAVALFQR